MKRLQVKQLLSGRVLGAEAVSGSTGFSAASSQFFDCDNGASNPTRSFLNGRVS